MQKISAGLSPSAVQESVVEYERPQIIAIGNLHDLLMGASGTLCDAVDATLDDKNGGGTDCI